MGTTKITSKQYRFWTFDELWCLTWIHHQGYVYGCEQALTGSFYTHYHNDEFLLAGGCNTKEHVICPVHNRKWWCVFTMILIWQHHNAWLILNPLYSCSLCCYKFSFYVHPDKMATTKTSTNNIKCRFWKVVELWCLTWIHHQDYVYGCEQTLTGSFYTEYHIMYFSWLVGAHPLISYPSRT